MGNRIYDGVRYKYFKCPVCKKKYAAAERGDHVCPYCSTVWTVNTKAPPVGKKVYIFSISGVKTKRKAWRNNLIIAFIFLLICAIFVTYPVIGLLTDEMQMAFVTSSTFSLNRIINIGAADGTNITLHIPVPQSNDVYGQNVLSIKAYPYFQLVEKANTTWFEWDSILNMVTNQTTFIVSYQIKENSITWNLNPDEYGSLSQISPAYSNIYPPDVSEWKITAGNSMIEHLAYELKGNSTNVYTILDNILLWEIMNIQYRVGNETYPHNATHTLELGWGKCDEMAFLFAALARDAGIPTWIAFGPLYDPTTQTWIDHAWDMSYMPLRNGGYIIGQIDPANKQFLLKDPYRFIEYVDNGNGSDMLYYYNYLSYTTINPGGFSSNERYVSISFKMNDVIIGLHMYIEYYNGYMISIERFVPYRR